MYSPNQRLQGIARWKIRDAWSRLQWCGAGVIGDGAGLIATRPMNACRRGRPWPATLQIHTGDQMLTCLITGRRTSSARPPRRVLLVEDDRPTRRALAYLLGSWGLEVRGTGSVAQAIAALSWEPSCVVLDLVLADGSGVDVLEHIRSNSMPIRVIVTTAASDPALLTAVSRLRPDLVLYKPVEVRVLASFLATC